MTVFESRTNYCALGALVGAVMATYYVVVVLTRYVVMARIC